jgi:VWFA-related protein
MTRRVPLVLCLGLCLYELYATAPGMDARQAQSSPVFRTGVEAIQLDVTVLDANRQPVQGLTAADFTIVERGEPQAIVAFTAVNLPGRDMAAAAWTREVASDVSTNHHDTQRVLVILLDDCSAPFNPMVAKTAKTIGHSVLDQLGPADLTAVVYTSARRQGQEFTTDHARLAAAIERFVPRGGAPTPAPFAAERTAAGGLPLGSGAAPCPASGPRPMIQAMQNAANLLREWPGLRKTLVFISSFTVELRPESIETAEDIRGYGALLAAMQEANLTIYQYDPRGLEAGSSLADDLLMFSDATGGRTTRLTNAPWEGVPQMFRENSSYYLLGFQPTDTRRNGRFRPIEVRVNRPGLTVRTRNGYYAPREVRAERPSRQPGPSVLDAAISGGLPAGDLPLGVVAAPFASPGSSSPVVGVVTGFSPLGMRPEGEEFDVLVTAFRDDWKRMATATQRIRSTGPASGSRPLLVDVTSRLELRPGRYEIRTAVTGLTSGHTGSAYTSVVVPDFGRQPLSLSGVLLALETGPDGSGGGSLQGLVPVSPTTLRSFTARDRVRAFARVHQSGRGPATAVTAHIRITDAADRVRFDQMRQLVPAAFSVATSADLDVVLPLAGLDAGDYLVTIEATSPRVSTSRHVRFAVR